MAKSFTVPCPSCEADVVIREEKMIGKKTDCPKCKYRFKVPDPNELEAEEVTAEMPSPLSKKGGSKGMVAAGVGVAAVALLGVVGFFLFSGDDTKKPSTAQAKPAVTVPAPSPDPMPKAEGEPTTPKVEGDPTKPEVPSTDGSTKPEVVAPPGAIIAPPMNQGGNVRPPQPKNDVLMPVPAAQMKDASNLLPGKTQAVLRLNMQKLQATPLYTSFLDRQTLEFFRTSMMFEATEVTNVYLALVGADRDPFAVIRTRSPVPSLSTMSQVMELQTGTRSPTKGRAYAIIKKNPFITAIGRALSTESLFGQAGIPITDEDKKRWQEKPLAICVYDSQTVLVGEVNWMEGYLDELSDNGYPPFQSELTPPPAPPPAPKSAEGGEPGAGGEGPGKVAPPGAVPMPMGAGPPGAVPMPMGAGTAPAGAAAPKGPKLFTSIPTYRTIRPELKRMLNRLEEDEQNQPALVYADVLDKRVFNRDYQSFTAQAGLLIGAIVEHAQVAGISIAQLQKEKFVADMVFDFVSAEDAKQTANEKLDGLLKILASLLRQPLGTNVQVLNYAGGQNNGGGNFPGVPGGDQTDTGVPPGPGGRGPGEGGIPGSEVDPNQPPGVAQPGVKVSKIQLGVTDTLVTIDAEIYWQAEAYTKLIQPGVIAATNQLKGRMSVLSGAANQYDLARPLVRLREEKAMVPPTTYQRDANIDRYGIPYIPEHRVSFMADLLPFLGKGGLRQSIQEKKFAWFAKEHEAAATTWVSEFLVPYYPQSSWRATHPLGEGRSFGGTNYVAISGLGLDSARYDPSKPEFAKKVGMTGYDWGSQPAEVTDGLSNTIYMIQVPPTHPRPWIAGGGATAQGVDDSSKNPIEDFVHTAPGGKRGTFVLMGDGSVRFVPEGINAEVFKAMATRAGGETISDIDKEAPKVTAPRTTETELKGSVGGAAPMPKTNDTAKEPAVEAEMDKLQGKWKVKKLILSKRGTATLPVEALALMSFQIVGDRQTLSVQGIELFVAEFKIDSTKNPKSMMSKLVRFADIPGAPPTANKPKAGDEGYAAYELKGDTLVIRTSPDGSKDYPKDTSVPEKGSKDDYIELERVK